MSGNVDLFLEINDNKGKPIRTVKTLKKGDIFGETPFFSG